MSDAPNNPAAVHRMLICVSAKPMAVGDGLRLVYREVECDAAGVVLWWGPEFIVSEGLE